MQYQYAEPVHQHPCDTCGQSPGEYNNIGLWQSDFDPKGPDKTLCLACAFKSPPSVSHLDELLYEGEVSDIHTESDFASLHVKTPFGEILVHHSAETERKEWHDPGGGVNGAGVPRRSQEWTETNVDSKGEVELLAPTAERVAAKTDYWFDYLNKKVE